MQRKHEKMKLTSLSNAALVTTVISGALTTVPVVANAANDTSAPVKVQTSNGKVNANSDFKVSVKNNDDGTQTVSVTMPKEEASKDSSLKDSSFTASTQNDNKENQAEVDNGKVTQSKGKANIKINLSKDALSNKDLMNDDLTVVIKDSNGKKIGSISNITLSELNNLADEQKKQVSDTQDQANAGTNASSSSSEASSSVSASVTSSSSDNSAKDQTTSSQSQSKATSSTESQNGSSKVFTDDLSVKGKPTSGNNTETSSATRTHDASGSATKSNGYPTTQQSQNGGGTSQGQQTQPQSNSSQPSSSSSSSSQPNGNNGGGNGSGSNGSGSDNSELPQTSNEKYSVAKAGVGVFGLIGSLLATLRLKKHN